MIIFWVFTIVSISYNKSWWNILEHTFSKLGRGDLAKDPWIFSTGVIIAGIFMFLHGLILVYMSKNKPKIVGSVLVLISGFYMILVGVFPDGTKPHDFIALSSFLFFYTGNLFYGIGSGDKKLKVWFCVLFAFALGGLFAPIWPSLGILEIYGLSIVMVECILIIRERERLLF